MMLSWEAASITCSQGFLQMVKFENMTRTYFTDQDIQNTSYWLGIYKDNTCKMHVVNNLENITQIKLKKCPYVENFNNTLGDCNEKNHAICVKPGETVVFIIFSNSLPGYLSNEIERIQKRALSIISPGSLYTDSLKTYNVDSLAERRQKLCD